MAFSAAYSLLSLRGDLYIHMPGVSGYFTDCKIWCVDFFFSYLPIPGFQNAVKKMKFP